MTEPPSDAEPASSLSGSTASMGYQPGLDGLRAISVIAVILYHAGFGWMPGGFLGVEVFFVVSGYLITSLLIDERERDGSVSLRGFWTRRARRLFPALAVVLLAVTLWALLFGSAEQAAQIKRDLPWSIGYLANWGQIVGGVPYFADLDPPLLRHLWSLAVEEQWYVLWPFAFIGLMRLSRLRVRVSVIAAAALGSWLLMWVAHRDAPASFLGWDPTNFAYLSTPTRASGLLLGALVAFVWRPWRDPSADDRLSRPLDLTAGIAVGVLLAAFIGAHLTEGYMYPWVLALTSVASLVAIMVVVHPAAVGARWVFGSSWLTAIGRRSYGLYLWHWPIFVIASATDGSWLRVVAASLVTVVIAEVSYRVIETPVRRGALGRWWSARRDRSVRWVPVVGAGMTVVVLAVAVASVDEFDIAVGGEEVEFSLDATDLLGESSTTLAVTTTTAPTATSVAGIVTTSTTSSTTSTSTTTTTLPVLPRSISIVGDSTALSFGVNLPSGLDETFSFTGDAATNGCSIWDVGEMVSTRGTRRDFAPCSGWQEKWASVSDGYDVALVVIGAWDVYDMANIDGSEAEPEVITPFGSELWDATFLSNMTSGVAALRSVGTEVAVLEVPCMRPQEVPGQGFPPTPERGDDDRVAHVNALLRSIADGDDHVHFIAGPVEWCTDEAIATDLGYRWDGVHVYQPGANLILETIAADLLRIPVVQD
ncbi:MAG: acyltransferase family protein [Ilumatobacteraceae bacterium]